MLAVRWYLRFNLSYRNVEELLVERGVDADRVTVYRWVQRFTPPLADAARITHHSHGDRWFVGETDVKVNGIWRSVYRAVDQHGKVIDVLVSARRDAASAPRFFHRALTTLSATPAEVVTDANPVYPRVLDDLVPSAWHHVERHVGVVDEYLGFGGAVAQRPAHVCDQHISWEGCQIVRCDLLQECRLNQPRAGARG